MGLFGLSKDKETIEKLTQQIYQQKAEYERKISEKDAEMSELKIRFGKREDSILAVKEIELQRLKDKIKALEDEVSNKTETENKVNDSFITSLREEYEKKIEELQKEIDSLKEQLRKNGQDKFDTNKFVLPAGKYKGGIDIPIGVYDIKVISGQGSFKTNKPEEIYENISSNKNHGFGFLNEYRNLEISEKTILRIENSANVEFSLSRKYDFSEELKAQSKEFETEKRILQGELSTLRQEIRLLSDEAVKKYYKFSNYNKITSEECKNKLALLKQQESELRERGSDVKIQKQYGRDTKTEDRIARQMLRTFNAECDNIMQGVGIKNIDKARKQVQTSYETINRLYAIDSAFLQKSLLELKLEQITLMYTYELKYQQEKDIQMAIKEQMLEEAKAQREIEEQKKKIEKDLQQHLGEVNRIMKYMQKTQIDAEKQLYMDKIKELEERIKVLQSDKETVLEREANAKAGFVYIISNIGSFGENIYKIGMTRRLEPMDRIHELSSASVPFEFDVHAMIFSSDAPELETTLHRHFASNAVNKVNPRKEFYNVDIDDIEKVVKENYNDTVQFTKIPIASEYRQSLNLAGA